MKQYVVFFLLVGLFLFAGPVKAELVFYTDRSAWESAVNSDITIEYFYSVTPYFLEAGINNAGLISIELIDHSQVNEFNSINDEPALSVNGTPFFRGNFSRSDINAVTNLILPTPVYAFGGDFYSANSVDGLSLEINGSEHAVGDLMPSDVGDGFLGFISTDAFSTVTLFNPVLDNHPVYRLGESFGLDNVSFAVPEPATLVLLGLGVLGLQQHRKSSI